MPQRERHAERASLAWRRSDMHGAAHATDGFLDDSQTDACPLILLLGMEAFKHLKNLLRIAWVDTQAIIAHGQLAVMLSYQAPAEFDPFAWRTVEFYRVADEVVQDLAQQDGLYLESRPGPLPDQINLLWQAQ